MSIGVFSGPTVREGQDFDGVLVMNGGMVYKNDTRVEPLILDMETRKNLSRR